MAIVRRLVRQTIDRDVRHTEVEATYTIVTDDYGNKYLQIDTYGSVSRKVPGKKSQSIRFAPEAIEELKRILSTL